MNCPYCHKPVLSAIDSARRAIELDYEALTTRDYLFRGVRLEDFDAPDVLKLCKVLFAREFERNKL